MDRPASESKNSNFRLKFGLPDSQYIDDEFSCAISKDILLHGRMYIAPLYLCFYSKIFSHRTMEVIPFQYVTAIEKKNTSLFIPDAIEVTANRNGHKEKYFFASFQKREEAVLKLRQLWAASSQPQHPAAAAPEPRASCSRASDVPSAAAPTTPVPGKDLAGGSC